MGYPATIRFRSNPADKGFNLYKQWGRPEMIHEAFVSWQAYIEKGNARSALKSAEAASGFLIANKDCDELCLSHGFNHEGGIEEGIHAEERREP